MAVHATGESLRAPHGPGTHVVVLSADEARLQTLAARLTAGDVAFRSIQDLDAAEGVLAIGVTPGPKDALRRYVSSLPLLR